MFPKFCILTIVTCIFVIAVVSKDVPFDNVPADSFKNRKLTESFSTNDNLENFDDFSSGCSVTINSDELPDPQPLIIIPGTNTFKNPTDRIGIILFDQGETVELFCSVSFVNFPRTLNIMARCISKTTFDVSGKEMAFNQLQCTDQVLHTGRVASVQNCGHNATALEIGFELNPTRFLKILDICHDERLESTLYVKYDQTPANRGFHQSFPRVLPFITGPFYASRDVDSLYNSKQRSTISEIIGDTSVKKFWDNEHCFYLECGHLADRADMIYEPQQRATFYFVNAAPQWQSFNAGNWDRIENSVRLMVADRNIDTEIYTGTWEIATLPDATETQRQLFLDFNIGGAGVIPVPKYFYKIVINKKSRSGVVFVGVNNPHATLDEINSGKYNLCLDVSSQINYIDWDRKNLAMGYSYACDVNGFVKIVNHLPASVRADSLLV